MGLFWGEVLVNVAQSLENAAYLGFLSIEGMALWGMILPRLT